MSIDRYRKKRRFDRTSEPEGGRPSEAEPLRFVVHKHAASRLHYDLRLELDGVLKSWAVPKGPSVDPADRRLAMMVEDHPFDYRDFEGLIPESEYGGGTVMLWDEGFYSAPGAADRAAAEVALRAGLAKGHVAFVLAGEKLRGAWDLVHIRSSGKEDNAWLLIKKDDEDASRDDVGAADRSARSGRSMAEIAESREPSESRVKPPPEAPERPFPDEFVPMLARQVDEPFDDPDWLFEIKWDGFRMAALLRDGTTSLRSRGGKDSTKAYPAIATELAALAVDAVIDGELVALDDEGRARFQLLQRHAREPAERLCYIAFDLLHLEGRSLLRLPLRQRKELLRGLVGTDLPHVRYADDVVGEGVAFATAAAELGLEGVMAKRANSVYQPGKRSASWLKIKTRQRREVVIGGFTEPRGSRRHLGAVLMGIDGADGLRYVGHVGASGGDRELRSLRRALAALERPTSPFTTRPRANAPVHWVEPTLRCDVEFGEETAGGKLRQPVMLGLAADPERATETSRAPKRRTKPQDGGRTLVIDGHELVISNWDKSYWPEDGITKGDLVEYYLAVSATMLPYLRDRPQSLNRFPNGYRGHHFYQKDMAGKAPEWARIAEIESGSDGSTVSYLVCDDARTLAYMAGLGCIEVHPWNSRLPATDLPDWCVIDFDPADNAFAEVVEAARCLHRICDRAGIPSVPKTSGATGLHVYIPLGARYEDALVRHFAATLARLVQAELPATTTLERTRRKRGGRIYIDHLQNRRGQTLAAPYSVRPRPGATVSTPLAWSEVTRRLDPTRHTLRTMPGRLERKGDLFADVLGRGADVERALHELSG